MANDKGTEAASATKGKGLRGKLNKVVLAYSGGLDTSVIVPWLRENYGCEVVCFTANVGQGMSELVGLEAKAKASGACQLVVKNLMEEFVKDYVYPCLRAGAVYERKYLLGTSMARPVIAKAIVDVAKEVGADAVAHGCTGKGNDQVCFELTFFALNPDLQVVAPWREWDITGREDAIEYAKKHNVPVPVTKKSIYSRDRNLWHLSHEGDILEDPANEPKKDMYMMSVDPEYAPDKPEYLEIGIVSGIPVSINGKELSPASLLSKLNDIGGRHGIGRIDMVENRLVGMKSRGVYETPGGTILAVACRELESLTLDREAIQFKDTMALKYAELVYAGRWFDPLRESMDAFMENITKTTTGSVTLKLYKGSVFVASRKSPYSLYREDISSFESGQIYDQADAAGFIRLYGLPMRVRAMLEKEQGKRKRVFNMINDLPTIFEVVSGNAKKQTKEKSSVTNHSSNKSKSKTKGRGSESQGKYAKVDEEGLEDEDEEHGDTVCGACGENFASDEFWICCEICERWFHGKCVQITPAKAERLKQYKCPSCRAHLLEAKR